MAFRYICEILFLKNTELSKAIAIYNESFKHEKFCYQDYYSVVKQILVEIVMEYEL